MTAQEFYINSDISLGIIALMEAYADYKLDEAAKVSYEVLGEGFRRPTPHRIISLKSNNNGT